MRLDRPVHPLSWVMVPVLLVQFGCTGRDARMNRVVAAIKAGESARACEILDKEKDLKLDAQDWHGLTALHHALQHGDQRAYDKLLALGASPNVCDSGGQAVMHVSAEHEDSYWLREALAHGGNANLLNQGNRHFPDSTPLYYALEVNDLRMSAF